MLVVAEPNPHRTSLANRSGSTRLVRQSHPFWTATLQSAAAPSMHARSRFSDDPSRHGATLLAPVPNEPSTRRGRCCALGPGRSRSPQPVSPGEASPSGSAAPGQPLRALNN